MANVELRASRRRVGFTLVELLVVLSIVCLLMGMMMPMLALAKRSSLRTASLATMAKVESALHQYKADFKGYPYQLNEADDTSSYTNALDYNLGTDIAPQDSQNVRDDMAAVEALYRTDQGSNSVQADARVASVFAYTYYRVGSAAGSAQNGRADAEGDVCPTGTTVRQHSTIWVYESVADNWTSWVGECALLNRLAAERSSINMLIGDVYAHGQVMPEIQGPAGTNLIHHGRDLSGQQLLANPLSAGKPGWANNYLLGQVDAKYIQGATILDAYFHPIIYINQTEVGVDPMNANVYGTYCDCPNPTEYGLQPIGRETLKPFIDGTTTPITGDQWLPDPASLLHSDRRHWAAPGYELEFELWSAGPDGQFGWWRDDAKNLDNVPCEPYDRGIGSMP